MPKRSDDYMQERQRQILDAATRCVLHKGWSRVTVDNVATAANLSKGAVYVHFGSKEALLQGLLERSVAAIEAIAECKTVEQFYQSLAADIEVLNGSQGRQLAMKQLEMVVESMRNPKLQKIFRRATQRLMASVTTVVRRLRPDLGAAAAAAIALKIIILLHGTRALRAQSDIPSGTALQSVLEREINTLLRPKIYGVRVKGQS